MQLLCLTAFSVISVVSVISEFSTWPISCLGRVRPSNSNDSTGFPLAQGLKYMEGFPSTP